MRIPKLLLKRTGCYILMLLPVLVNAQKLITGTVKDSKGHAVVGATVTEKGASRNATTTNENGMFKITLKKKPGSLIISSVGFKEQETKLNDLNDIAVSMQEDAGALNEVIVVGYGTQKKKDLTGSVSSINSDHLNLGGTTSNLGQAIQGRAAGVQVQQSNFSPGGSIAITIRGGNSINTTNAPLYVVDGFITDNGNLINPNDIEDIQILKDASAAAIYGSRGGNGVVLITTKKGRPGRISI